MGPAHPFSSAGFTRARRTGRPAALLRLVVRALIGLLPGFMTVTAWADDPPGKVAYNRVCAQCHGDDPADGDDGPALVPMSRNAKQVIRIVRGGRGRMHPVPESKISDVEIVAIVDWLQMQNSQ